jgi:hypothetical protein
LAILREYARRDKGKVTAGIPSLSPAKRFYLTDAALQHIYQQNLVAEAVKNDKWAADPGDGQRTMAEWAAQVGIPLSAERIITRLRRLNNNLVFERSRADESKWGVYLAKHGGTLEFLCGFEAATNPEFTVVQQDERGQFKKFIPGWRRILMRLIRAKLISESAANRVFGPPNRDSQRWAELTQ